MQRCTRRLFILCLPLLTSFAFISTAADATDLASSATELAQRRVAAFRDSLSRLERDCRQHLALGGIAPGAVARARQANALRERFESLRAAESRLPIAARPELHRKLRAIGFLLGKGETAPAWTAELTRPAPRVEMASDCTDAALVDAGRYAASRPLREGSDVWVRYRAAASGTASVGTVGSDLDTIVEVFDTCPASESHRIADGDDEQGLQAAAAFATRKGGDYWIRVAASPGSRGIAVVTLSSSVSGFAGEVRSEGTGAPLNREVHVWNQLGNYVMSVDSQGGIFVAAGLSPGTYFASTGPDWQNDGWLDELWDGIPSPYGDGVPVTTGTPIAVESGVIRTDIDFELGHGGAVAGRVRDSTSGAVLAGFEVDIYGATGQWIGDTTTDAGGRYQFSGLGPGTVYALVDPPYYSTYQGELFANHPCPDGCDVTEGTPIVVSIGQVSSGVDFGLDPAGGVAGTVTEAIGGAPIVNLSVQVIDADGEIVRSATTDVDGSYLVSGVPAGSYYVRTGSYAFRDELYPNTPCEGGCDTSAGTPVAVSIAQTTSGVDLALNRMGEISGNLTDETTHGALSGWVTVYDAGGGYLVQTYTWDGSYRLLGLEPATHFVAASAYGYRQELFDDIACPPNEDCPVDQGTAILTALDDPTTGIDLALTSFGKIAGRVTEDGSGDSLYNNTIKVWDISGNLVATAYSYFPDFSLTMTTPGSYYVAAFQPNHYAELHANQPCPAEVCELSAGTAVTVGFGATTTVDFSLAPLATVSGTVRAAGSGNLLDEAVVQLYDAGGQVRGSIYTEDGLYSFYGVRAGTYHVVAGKQGYTAQAWNHLPCAAFSCDLGSTTPIVVGSGGTVGGIDFDLLVGGSIAGVVRREDGSALPYANVSLYTPDGAFVAGYSTNGAGQYEIAADAGNWLVAAYSWSDYGRQLFDGVDCPQDTCNFAAGTLVPVSSGTMVSGIDFLLKRARGILGQVRDGGRPVPGVAIDLWSNDGSHEATTATDVTGHYNFYNVSSGTYYVSTDNGRGGLDELWNDIACPLGPAYAGLCNPLAGTPVLVPAWNALVPGIDFDLTGIDLFTNGFEAANAAWGARTTP